MSNDRIELNIDCIDIECNCINYSEKEVLEDINTLIELYHHCKKSYGRCTGKVYIDIADNKVQHIGYVFRKIVDKRLCEYWLTPMKVTNQYLQ